MLRGSCSFTFVNLNTHTFTEVLEEWNYSKLRNLSVADARFFDTMIVLQGKDGQKGEPITVTYPPLEEVSSIIERSKELSHQHGASIPSLHTSI